MVELIKIKKAMNATDPLIFLDPREVKMIRASNAELSDEEKKFIADSEDYYNSAIKDGDPVSLLKDHSLSLEYSKELETIKDQLEFNRDQLELKNQELETNKKQLEDDLAAETDAKLKMKKSSFQSALTYVLVIFVFVYGLFPAIAEVTGHKLSASTITFTERTLLQVIPILAMVIMHLFNVKKFSNEGNGKFNIEKYDA